MTALHLGDSAPDFTVMTTDGEISFREWKNHSWAVFFSHPAGVTAEDAEKKFESVEEFKPYLRYADAP